MNEYKIISNNIKAERIRRGYTQEDIANKLGVTRKTYLNYEKKVKSITPLQLYKLACIYECNIDDFYLGFNTTNRGE